MRQRRIGVDVGATGIKAAVVDLVDGGAHPPRNEPTPTPAVPKAVAECVAEMIASWRCPGRIGVALPCTVNDGVALTAVNIPSQWIDTDAEDLFGDVLGREVVVLNDTDAAGIAEAHYGVADHPGTVLVLTFGTGIGSAVLRGGKLEPNTEFGQLRVDGYVADSYVSLSGRHVDRLSWPAWIDRANRFLRVVEEQDNFDLIVIGGGITHEAVHWEGQLTAAAPLVRARFFNMAGVIGAAMAAEHGIDGVFRRRQGRRRW
jgi:polyphosphate glucokinase